MRRSLVLAVDQGFANWLVIYLPEQGKRQGDAVYVAVVGPGDDAEERDVEAARKVGYELARHGAVLVCGGLSGVMQAACEGVYLYTEESGDDRQSIGLLPGTDHRQGNAYLTVTLPTGLGELRNGLVVRAAHAIISVGCSWGTLSEIALAMRMARPVVTIAGYGWEITYRHNRPHDEPYMAASPEEAAAEAVNRGRGISRGTGNSVT